MAEAVAQYVRGDPNTTVALHSTECSAEVLVEYAIDAGGEFHFGGATTKHKTAREFVAALREVGYWLRRATTVTGDDVPLHAQWSREIFSHAHFDTVTVFVLPDTELLVGRPEAVTVMGPSNAVKEIVGGRVIFLA